MKSCLPLLVTLLSSVIIAKAEVTLTELDNHRVRIEVDGKLFTEYRYEPGFFPILYPVIGPNGVPVTRHYPMKSGPETRQKDHEHHRSLHFTHGDVNGFNFWAPQVKKNGHDTEVVHDRFEKIESGKTGTLVVWTKWIGDGELQLRERKTIRFMPVGKGQMMMDYDVELHAPDSPVVFGDTDDAGLAVRVATSMIVKHRQKDNAFEGKGTLLNSRGHRNEEAWGKRAEWVDYFGPDDTGKTVGITVFDHPSNMRYPTGWHARYYGLLSASRWGIASFEKKQGAEKGDGVYTLSPKAVLRLRNRYYFHHGDTGEAKVGERFASYAGTQRFHPVGTELSPRIIYKGVFIGDTAIAGEQKKDWAQPSHPYCWQLSRDRFLWVFQTRSFEGIDTERSILYQIRKDRPDGPVIREKLLIPFRDDWDPFGDGSKYWKVNGQPKVFGVPKGAIGADGKIIPHHNHFALMHYRRARAVIDGKAIDPHADPKLEDTLRLEWLQFRLNDEGDDIELLTQPKELRQKGYETGDAFCAIENARRMNSWVHPAEAMDDSYTRWLDVPHFNNSVVAAIEFHFNAKTSLYEWTRTGNLLKPEPKKGKIFESSINRLGDDWILCVRNRGHVLEGQRGSCTAWFKTKAPFSGFGKPTYVPVPSSYCPRTAYLMPDGKLRIFSGDIALSPHRQKRDPLFSWDVDPKDFSVSNRRTIMDGRQNLGMQLPMIGFAKLSPVHNKRQILTFRVTTQNHRHATEKWPAVTEHDLAQSGAHYSVIRYEEDVPNTWRFE